MIKICEASQEEGANIILNNSLTNLFISGILKQRFCRMNSPEKIKSCNLAALLLSMDLNPQKIRIEDFDYPLPDERIARFPLAQRDQSKLLVMKDGQVSEDVFANLVDHLPADSIIVFNETRVIHARLVFHKVSGSRIEIFCLEPSDPSDIQIAFQQQGTCIWKCLVGNAKRWKEGKLSSSAQIGEYNVVLTADLLTKEEDAFEIRFSWTPSQIHFAQVLEVFGKIPLPPYIDREAEDDDNLRYQTMFARNDGSVAAPTAGLHFTPEVMQSLAGKNIDNETVTLHVGAGTFKPVSSETMGDHHMHAEHIIVPLSLLKKLLKHQEQYITLVGTTTVRTLESVYWQGIKWLNSPANSPMMQVEQWDPYFDFPVCNVTPAESLECVIKTLEEAGLTELRGTTSLMIAPGYSYKIPDLMITNFHQPKSTLLLLVAAFVGAKWKGAYNFALKNDFRFLSYGDSCLFFKHKPT